MALATVEQLRAYLGQPNATKDDTLLSTLLESASAFFESEVGRSILAADYTDTVDGNGTTSLLLTKGPVISVSSVVVGEETIPERPAVTDDGWVLQNDRVRLVGYTFTAGVSNVVVSYRAGWETVPSDVQGAVCELAAMKYRQRDSLGVFSRAIIGQEQTMYQTVSLPIQIQRVIDNYRVPVVG